MLRRWLRTWWYAWQVMRPWHQFNLTVLTKLQPPTNHFQKIHTIHLSHTQSWKTPLSLSRIMQTMHLSWRRLRLPPSQLSRVLIPIIQKIRTTQPSHTQSWKTPLNLSQIMLTMPTILLQLITPTCRSQLLIRKHQVKKLPKLILKIQVRFLSKGTNHSQNILHLLLSWLRLLLRIRHGQLLLLIHNGLLMPSMHLSSPKLLS